MTDIFSQKKRSEIMSLIRATNTKPELAFRKLVSRALYPNGYRYRLHYKALPGKPDLVFVRERVACFVDGSFWHGYKLRKGHAVPKKYWLKKIENNMHRDKQVNRRLRASGWKVVRVWEHDVMKSPEKVLAKVIKALELPEPR